MARVSIKSICDELMAEFKTIPFIQKRLLKKLDKEVDEAAIKAQANRLVREGVIDHAKAAKKYGIRGPKADAVEAKPTKRKAKVSKEDKAEKPAKTMRKTKVSKTEKPAKSSKKKSEKVSKASAKDSKNANSKSKNGKTRRRSKA